MRHTLRDRVRPPEAGDPFPRIRLGADVLPDRRQHRFRGGARRRPWATWGGPLAVHAVVCHVGARAAGSPARCAPPRTGRRSRSPATWATWASRCRNRVPGGTSTRSAASACGRSRRRGGAARTWSRPGRLRSGRGVAGGGAGSPSAVQRPRGCSADRRRTPRPPGQPVASVRMQAASVPAGDPDGLRRQHPGETAAPASQRFPFVRGVDEQIGRDRKRLGLPVPAALREGHGTFRFVSGLPGPSRPTACGRRSSPPRPCCRRRCRPPARDTGRAAGSDPPRRPAPGTR